MVGTYVTRLAPAEVHESRVEWWGYLYDSFGPWAECMRVEWIGGDSMSLVWPLP